MLVEHDELMMNMLHVPDHQSLLHLMIQTMSLMCTGIPAYAPRFQYSAQMCITATQAHVTMLKKHHQLMVRYDADHISPSTASSDSRHKTDVDWNKVQRSDVQNSTASDTCCVWWLLTETFCSQNIIS